MCECARPRLSIVIPAYNESERLPTTLKAIDEYVTASGETTEIIVAEDGSEDNTLSVARAFVSRDASYHVLPLPHRGKAAAVRSGILMARGEHVLFTDADLSTPIEYASRLVRALDDGADVAIGSREGAGATRVSEPGYRHVMGRAFNLMVRLVAVPGIDDTQCGFKAFRRDVAADLFGRARLHVGGGVVRGARVTGFDVEILHLARRRGYTVAQIPVFWEHVSGSKVHPLRDSFRMATDVARVRLNAMLGRYD
ncbi:MAG TPA: dolichyl-phosphate beta-glucosyltransferase [Thermomicrobiales bacterium]|nr:dolichyl-phosphate beta-glucosyltransferase [Thermomicrobiales bacterium]